MAYTKEELELLNTTEYTNDKLVLIGRIPSKKNSRITDRRTGRSFPSASYTSWVKLMSKQISAQFLIFNSELLTNGIFIRIYYPDNRKADLTNKSESIMDLLVDTGILEDDNWKVTGAIVMVPEYRKNAGGCEIHPISAFIKQIMKG
jgi:Holliday junction resolvase RusA-like endonuclease